MSNRKQCRYPGCIRARYANGWCASHNAQTLTQKGQHPISSETRSCGFPECGREHYAKGWCRAHWEQERAGRELYPVGQWQSTRPTIRERLEAGSQQRGSCRIWIKSRWESGYGKFGLNREVAGAHRVAWEDAHGPIPDGLVLNHKCGNRACITLDHLELVTIRQNNEYKVALSPGNTTGYRGVTLTPAGRYHARVKARGVTHHLGSYDTAEEAAEAAERGRRELHTMPEFKDRVRALHAGAIHTITEGA